MIHLQGPGSIGSVTLSTSSGQSARSMTENESQLPLSQQDFGQVLDHSAQRTREHSAGQPPAETQPPVRGTRGDSGENPAVDAEASVKGSVDDIGSHEHWLSLLEDWQAIESGDSSLAQLAAEDGLSSDELKAALRQAIVQLDDSAPASYGKELPDRFDLSTTAATLGQLLEQKDELALDPKLSHLLQIIGELPEAQQKSIQSQLALVIDDLPQSVASPDETQVAALRQLIQDYRQLLQDYSEEDRAAALHHLSSEEVKILQAFATDWHALSLLNEQRTEQQPGHNVELHPESWQALLAKLVGDADTVLPKVEAEQNQAGHESQNPQDKVDAFTQTELFEALQQLSTALTTQLRASTDTSADDVRETTDATSVATRLQAALDEVMALLNPTSAAASEMNEGQVVTNDEAQPRVAAIQQLVQQLRTLVNASVDDAESGMGLDTEQAALLVTELRQVLQRHETEQRSSGHSVNQPNQQLPPAAQALSDVARQVREQLTAMQANLPVSEAAEGSRDVLTELLQRLDTSSGQANIAARNNELGLAVSNSTPSTAAAPLSAAREPVLSQTPAQSAFETARQTQQALDILGNGAPDRLRERISVMFNTRTQAAEMRLDPPDLGRLTIRLNMNQEQASVSFQVSSPQAREALEQSFPRLRDLLAEQGIQLADANVSEQQGQSRQQPGEEGAAGRQAGTGYELGEINDDAEVIELQLPTALGTGRVDYFV